MSFVPRAPAIRGLVRRSGLSALGFGMLLMPALLWPTQAFADPPIAVDDSVTVVEDAAATLVDVLANDQTSGGLRIVAATDPAHGTVVIAGDGPSLTYQPDADYNGPDTFDYTVLDDSAAQDVARVDVTVTPVNDPPVALDDPGIPCQADLDRFGGSFPVPEDWVGDYDGWFVIFGDCGLLGNDTDVDGDTLDWEIVSQPSHGEALYVEPQFFAYKSEPNWSTLPGDQPGGDWVSDSFTYRAFDGTAYSEPATMRFWIAQVNDPPTFTPGPDVVVTNEDTEYEGAWATDISAGPPNESYQSVTFEIRGVHSAEPDLFIVGPTLSADGVLSFTPAPDAFGIAHLDVRAKDDGGLDHGIGNDGFPPPDDTSDEVEFEIQILPVNDPPVAADDTEIVDEDGGATPIAVVGNDTDVDGPGQEVVAVSNPAHGTASTDGGGALYEPDQDYYGPDTFTYTIDDGEGGQDTATVTVTVEPTDDAPFADDDTATLPEDSLGTRIPVLVGDTDVDGDAVHVIEVSNGFKGTVTITGNQLAVRYKPFRNANGSDSFTYTITDPDGFTSTATVDVTISPVNDPPIAGDDGSPVPLQVFPGTGAASLNVLDNDSLGPDWDETLSIVDVTQPAHGIVSIAGGGWSLFYEAIGVYVGPDQFTYTISDDLGLTDTATVRVIVTTDPTPPVAVAPRVVISAGSGATGLQATIAWIATDLQSGISRYQLQQQVDAGGWATIALPTLTTTRLERALSAGHDYRFRVRAKNGGGIFGAYVTSRVTHL